MPPSRNAPVRRRGILAWILLALAGYFALFGGEYSAFRLWSIEGSRTREEASVEELRNEVERLQLRADSLESDPATLERLARERYGLVREGERLYRFVEGAAATDPGSDPQASNSRLRRDPEWPETR